MQNLSLSAFEQLLLAGQPDIKADEIIVGTPSADFCTAYMDRMSTGQTGYLVTLIFVGLFVLSVIGLSFIATSILYSEKLQSHPQPMIAWICIAEACMSYNALMEVINPVYMICYFSMYKILGVSLFKTDMTEDDYRTLANTQCNSNSIFYSFFQLISLTLNLCLCIDLILTIADPFSPAYRRTKLYYIFSFAFSVFAVLIIFSINSADNTDCITSAGINLFVQVQNSANLVLAMCLSVYIVVAIYSTVYSYRRLHRPGVSAPVRGLFVKKHFLYVVVFIFIWMIQQSNNYFWLFNPDAVDCSTTTRTRLPPLHRLGRDLGMRAVAPCSSYDGPNPIQVLSGLMTFSTGIFLSGVRLAEPLIRVLLMEVIYGFFGEIYDPNLNDAKGIEELKRQDQALSQILTSSLNVELVFVILKSITSFSQNDSLSGRVSGNVEGVVFSEIAEAGHEAPIQLIDMNAPDDKFMRDAETECTKKRMVTLQQIEIKMVDNFADKRISEFIDQEQDFQVMNTVPEAAPERRDTTLSNFSKTSQGRLRQMSEQVKSIFHGAKTALHLDCQEELDTMTINEEVQVIEWAPSIFHAIKKMDQITPEMIEESLNTDSNCKQLFKAKESAGKSGSFMFSSYDKRFLIKTMNASELKVLREALPQYLEHLKKFPQSMIAKIYGIYTVKMEDIREVHILLMDNLFLHVQHKLSEFDLKGSIINREVHPPFEVAKNCLKDVNLQTISKELKFLRFQRTDMRIICQRILEDIKFMATHNLMDYSLLLITEQNPNYNEDESIDFKSQMSLHSQNTQKLPRMDSANLFKRQVSGIPEVLEEDEDEEDNDDDDVGSGAPHVELVDKLNIEKKSDHDSQPLKFQKMNRVNTVSESKSNNINLFNSSESGFRNGTMVNIKHAKQLIKNFNTENQGNQHRYISSCGRYIYNLAIIDYLQAFDFEKHGENLIKVWLYRRDGALISACHPNPYARRYLHFMREHVIINQSRTEQERSSSFQESFIYDK